MAISLVRPSSGCDFKVGRREEEEEEVKGKAEEVEMETEWSGQKRFRIREIDER